MQGHRAWHEVATGADDVGDAVVAVDADADAAAELLQTGDHRSGVVAGSDPPDLARAVSERSAHQRPVHDALRRRDVDVGDHGTVGTLHPVQFVA